MFWMRSMTFRIILFESVFFEKTNELSTEEKIPRCCNFIGIYLKRFTERYQIFIEIITISIHFMKRIVWLGVE